jgi:hypothetical protein
MSTVVVVVEVVEYITRQWAAAALAAGAQSMRHRQQVTYRSFTTMGMGVQV